MLDDLGASPGQVTIADLFRVMSSIQTDMAKAVTKLEVIDSRNSAAEKKADDFENRIRALESARAKIVGASLTVGTLAGILSGIISSLHH